MILTCNSCEKKFIVPDSAITDSGRLVQCSSCGNKWKQFPIAVKSDLKTKTTKIKPQPKINQTKKVKRVLKKRRTGPNLYTPEYLSKKHGLIIGEKLLKKNVINPKNLKIGFGFYNSLIVLIAFCVLFFGVLINSQEYLITSFPISEIYINYFYETIYNINSIIRNLLSDFLNP